MNTPKDKKSLKPSSGSKRARSSSKKSAGRKAKTNSALRNVNRARQAAKEDRERAKKFMRWHSNTRSSLTGSGNPLRRAVQMTLILFLLSHFIVLSETHNFDTAHRNVVYREMAKQTGASFVVQLSVLLSLHS